MAPAANPVRTGESQQADTRNTSPQTQEESKGQAHLARGLNIVPNSARQ